MCTAPGILPNGQLIGCRKCEQCKSRRIDDWVGRCVAESKTAKACNFVTLTYGEDTTYGGADHTAATVLTYSDVQKFFKKVRKAGYPVRYFAVGEYGTLKGRAHWHILMYWQDKVPEFELDKRVHSPFWADRFGKPLGFVQWENMSPRAVRYCCKYLQKDIGELARQGHLAMSKKPPLGHEYFQGLAARYVEAGLCPQDLFYGWPDVGSLDGVPTKFMLGYKSADNFIHAFVHKFIDAHGHDNWGSSELVEDYVDKWTREGGEEITKELWESKEFIRAQKRDLDPDRVSAAKPVAWPTVVSPVGYDPAWSEWYGTWFAYDENEKWVWWPNKEGEWAWMHPSDVRRGGVKKDDAWKKKGNFLQKRPQRFGGCPHPDCRRPQAPSLTFLT